MSIALSIIAFLMAAAALIITWSVESKFDKFKKLVDDTMHDFIVSFDKRMKTTEDVAERLLVVAEALTKEQQAFKKAFPDKKIPRRQKLKEAVKRKVLGPAKPGKKRKKIADAVKKVKKANKKRKLTRNII